MTLPATTLIPCAVLGSPPSSLSMDQLSRAIHRNPTSYYHGIRAFAHKSASDVPRQVVLGVDWFPGCGCLSAKLLHLLPNSSGLISPKSQTPQASVARGFESTHHHNYVKTPSANKNETEVVDCRNAVRLVSCLSRCLGSTTRRPSCSSRSEIYGLTMSDVEQEACQQQDHALFGRINRPSVLKLPLRWILSLKAGLIRRPLRSSTRHYRVYHLGTPLTG